MSSLSQLHQELNLSDIGLRMFDKAIEYIKQEQEIYHHIRTKFFYPQPDGNKFEIVELRQIIDDLVQEFHLRFSPEIRNTRYMDFLNNKAFDIFKMKMHRLSPENYLVTTQTNDGTIIFIIRDSRASATENIKIIWSNTKLTDGIVEKVPFHISREMIQIE